MLGLSLVNSGKPAHSYLTIQFFTVSIGHPVSNEEEGVWLVNLICS